MARERIESKRAPREATIVIDLGAANLAAQQKYEIIEMVMARKDLTGHEKVVFWVIANSLSPGPWRSKKHHYEWIAKRAGVSRQYAMECVKKLEGKRLVQVQRTSKGTPNIYALVPLDAEESATDDSRNGQGVNQSCEGSQPEARKESTTGDSNTTTSTNTPKRKMDSGRRKIPVVNGIDPEERKRYFRMLDLERERGHWPFEREPKSTIPRQVIEEWESKHG